MKTIPKYKSIFFDILLSFVTIVIAILAIPFSFSKKNLKLVYIIWSKTIIFLLNKMSKYKMNSIKNKLLRKAMALAFDSQRHNQLFGFGVSLLSNQILPATVVGFNPKLPPKEYNLEKAKALQLMVKQLLSAHLNKQILGLGFHCRLVGIGEIIQLELN